MTPKFKSISKITKDTWEKMAESYTKYRESGESMNELIEIPAMEKLIGNVSGLSILDAGCGYGHYSIWAKKAGARRVVGVDISEKMIGEAKKRAQKEKLDIEFIQSDLSDLRVLKIESFDLAMCSIVVSYFGDLVKYFSEFARVLKRGGKFVFSEVHPMRSAASFDNRREGNNLEIVNYMPSQERTVTSMWKDKNGKKVPITFFHYTIEDFSKALKKSGFLIEEINEPPLSDRASKGQRQKYNRSARIPVFILFKAVKI